MEMKDLYGTILMITLVGMLIGLGILTFEKVGDSAYQTLSVNLTSTTANASSNVTLSVGNLTGSQTAYNSSGELIPSAQYTVYQNALDGNKAYFRAVANLNNSMTQSIYIFTDYKNYNTPTRSVMDYNRTELSGISSNWLGLLITIIVMSIIVGMVLASFRR